MALPLTTVEATCLCGRHQSKPLREVAASFNNRRCTYCRGVIGLANWQLPDGTYLDQTVTKKCDRCHKKFKAEVYKSSCFDCFLKRRAEVGPARRIIN